MVGACGGKRGRRRGRAWGEARRAPHALALLAAALIKPAQHLGIVLIVAIVVVLLGLLALRHYLHTRAQGDDGRR